MCIYSVLASNKSAEFQSFYRTGSARGAIIQMPAYWVAVVVFTTARLPASLQFGDCIWFLVSWQLHCHHHFTQQRLVLDFVYWSTSLEPIDIYTYNFMYFIYCLHTHTYVFIYIRWSIKSSMAANKDLFCCLVCCIHFFFLYSGKSQQQSYMHMHKYMYISTY